jgi:hypothetical protein
MNAPVIAPAAPAPAPASAPAPAPAAPREAVIDQNPVNTPAPVGAQAPPRSPTDHRKPSGRPESRREVIAAAFAKSREGVEFPAAKPRVGHNQPPEPVEAETPAPSAGRAEPRLDLRKRPESQRDEGGRFSRREPVGPSAQQEAMAQPGARPGAQPGAQPTPGAPQTAAQAAHREAPARMNAAARQAWATTPDPVRAEVHRMQREFDGFYQRARGDVAEMAQIRPFHELARKQGTTLQRALTNYVSLETKLRQDPIGGLDVLVRNMNLRTADGQQITHRDIAHYLLSRSPEQQALTHTSNVQGAHDAHIQALTRQVAQLAGSLQQMHNQQQYTQRYGQTRQGVDRFAETHPRLDELGDTIVEELRAGHTLEQAYRRADLLRPSAAQTRGGGAGAAQTRSVDRSISGAPAGAAAMNGRGAGRSAPSHNNRRDVIADAVRKARGSL